MRTDRSPLLPPTSWAFGGSTTAGMSAAMPSALFAVGTVSSSSRETVRCCVAPCTSTSGVAPETVMVSCSWLTVSSTSTWAVKLVRSSRPSRLSVAKAASENVTVYTPGRNPGSRYWPRPSVTVERTFSMSAGLVASTVTPGSTPPEASLTVPVMAPVLVPCARAIAEKSHRPAHVRRVSKATRLI